MPHFRKKPVVIEAVQYDGTDSIKDFAEDSVGMNLNPTSKRYSPTIKTMEGVLHVSLWDWVIKGVSNEFYPCKPDIFEKTYEPVN